MVLIFVQVISGTSCRIYSIMKLHQVHLNARLNQNGKELNALPKLLSSEGLHVIL